MISAKIGSLAHSLLGWVKRSKVDSGKPVRVPSDMAKKLKVLEHENRELRQVNGILRNGFAFSSARKWPHVRNARRSFEFKALIALVV